jgi:alcohol dehydrogenase (cytochrome c)
MTRFKVRALASTVLAGTLTVVAGSTGFAADVTAERLLNAQSEPQNWLLPFGNYEGHMFSQLDEINRDNVANLKVAFTQPMGTAMIGSPDLNLMNAGIVDDGILFVDDGWGGIYKVDLHGGRSNIQWLADAAVSKDERNRTRGMAILGNAVFHNLNDGRVVAVDQGTGEFLWDKQIARVEHPKGTINQEKENFTAAPLAVEGKILVGQSGGDDLTRGWLAALDPATGDELWRTYTVPAPGEPGHETWQDENQAWKVGGAALWTTGTYDAETGLTYWGTGNAQPMFDVEYRPGDNLYAGAVVAFDVDDGSIDWHFQYTPNEGWDYDENGVHQIIKGVEIEGEQRDFLGHWARNGFFYRLDQSNGQFIDATQYVETVNWTKGIDPKTGKPVEYDPSLAVQTYIPETRMLRGDPEESFCPDWLGGVRWQPPAYNAEKFISYSAGFDGCSVRPVVAAMPLEGGDAGIDPDAPGGIRGALAGRHENPGGLVAAVDVRTNEMVATHEQPYDNQSGVLATAGGLVFTATLDGGVVALNDETLEEIWRFDTGIVGVKAPVFTFSVDDKQYIAVVAGGRSGAVHAPVYPDLANKSTGAMIYFFAL